MAEDAAQLTPEEHDAMIEDFEALGSATFRIGHDRAAFDALNAYIRKNTVPTLTDVNRKEGYVVITKRPLGSLEIG